MIAEYERAQILERSRRGKRHRAQSGEVSVMSGAPYGYRYMRKTEEAPAAYAVLEAEARVVQRIYELYTVEGLSIGEITRRINAEGIPTRKASARWERSTVWAVLRNSAYRGVACFGKTRASSRTRVIRPQRRRGVITPSMTAGHERPREEWIEIPVPALVSEDSFARAQELLEQNKIRSRRRTIEPSIVQGLVSCQKCGYAFARTSTRTSARKIHYYKCIGSDGWRKLGGPVCNNGRFVRQDLLDPIVWDEVVRLLEDPTLIQQELDRRLEAARSSNPTKKREQSLQRELAQVGKGIERLLSAYQEALVSIEQLRERMPTLRQREQTLRAELRAITDQANDRATFLRLAETLTAFLARLRSAADTLSINERQRIVRLVVKDVLIGEDTITIRHSIPVQQGPPQDGCIPPGQTGNSNYLLCKGRGIAAAGEHLSSLRFRSMGPGMASKEGAWRCDRRALRRRHRGWIPERRGCQTVLGGTHRAVSEVSARTAPREDAPAGVWTVRGREPEAARGRKARDVRLPRLHAYLRKEEEQRLFHGGAADGSQAIASKVERGENRVEIAYARFHPGYRQVVAGGCGWAHPILRSAHERRCAESVPLSDRPALAPNALAPKPEEPSAAGTNAALD